MTRLRKVKEGKEDVDVADDEESDDESMGEGSEDESEDEEIEENEAEAEDNVAPLQEVYDTFKELSVAFLKRWGLKGHWNISWFIKTTGELTGLSFQPSLSNIVHCSLDSVNSVIASGSPIFQRRCVTHLPAEIIHLVMQSSDNKSARRLGSTCKFFREISRWYIYTVRRPLQFFPFFLAC